ncbi:hypothetical protein HXX76_001889 [Chlamydomonas incerta]|uniref:RING-type domain-containing protein n=1 Tax=Chlamydomonas incerta TaxID=51695 RepID=A0A835TGX3_CHLIN|nr:hypothetical protein HXX76_001889 [Chlamydomonas incerta]|eukprot:KAG2443537.1 hypothetical protein HXX76_001889 [Chlamydomonas incerta]
MGVVILTIQLCAAVTAVRVVWSSLSFIIACGSTLLRAVLSVSPALQLLWLPPHASAYTGPATWWDLAWRLLTLQPLLGLFARGSFMRAYALIVVPVLGVWAVGIAALLAGAGLLKPLLQALPLLCSVALCLMSLALAEDSVRRLLLPGRVCMAVLRGSAAAWMGLFGWLGTLAQMEPGVTKQEVADLSRLLALCSSVAVFGSGGGTLVWHSGGWQADAGAAGPEAAERLAFAGYGTVALLAAAGCLSALTGDSIVLPLLRALVRALDAVLRVRPALEAAARAVRWLAARPALRAGIAAVQAVDQTVTRYLAQAWNGALGAARSVGAALTGAARAFRQRILPTLHRSWTAVRRDVLEPVGRAVRAVAKASVRAGVSTAKATHRYVLKPAAAAAWRLAVAAFRLALRVGRLLLRLYRLLLLPVLRLVGDLVRRFLAPLLWPAGTVAGTWWFARQALLQRAPLPFGAAAAVGGVVVCLMAGKSMRKTRWPALSRAGGGLESAAAVAYLNLDLGLGRLVRWLALATFWALSWAAAAALSTGRWVLALVTGPVLALLAAMVAATWWALDMALRIAGPYIQAGWRALHRAALVVWRNPALSLLLSTALLAALYAAHQAGLPAAVWRAVIAAVWAACSLTYRVLEVALTPALRLLRVLLLRAAAVLGLSADASAAALARSSSALTSWGSQATVDISSLFASRDFAAVFVGLHLAHALLLRYWAKEALQAQGGGGGRGGGLGAAVGDAVITHVVSFVARSTAKVALGPMYVTAAAAFVAGSRAGGVATRLAGLTAPALWVVYLAALWVEGVRRVELSYETTQSSEFASALRSLREHRRQPVGASSTRTMQQQESSPAPPSTAAAAAGSAPLQPAPVPQLPLPRPPLDPVTERLLCDLLSQPLPKHVYPSDACSVCFDELGAEATSSDRLLAVMSQHGPSGGPRGGGVGADGAGTEAGGKGEGEQPLQVLRCGHVFHRECVLLWLKRNPRCPCCREPAVGRSRHTNMLF